ncbi:MAG TPA: ATP-binding protein, partial [Kofleriaceae bacterium]|nr:ATP-binding protein [Kofleriaceae bacterium]
ARVDAQGKFIMVNAAYAAMLGRSREEMVGRPWQCTVQADQIGAMEQATARMLASGKVQTETVGVRGDGSTFDKHIVMVAVRGSGGEPSGHYCFSKDISNQKQAQRDLVRAKLAAEAAMRARSDFLARMSHEIRTPMNGVIGMAQLALETELTLQQREYVETARSSAASLLHLIDDILDFTKIDSGHLRLETIPFQLRSCLGSALKGLAQRAHSKGLTFLIDIPPAVPERLIGDPQRLAQIAINLVGNAIKFTERGQICLSVAVEERRGGLFFRFGVTDSGIGVDEDKQKAIFEDFAQADDGVTRRYGGTGLGLAICRQLVHLMGGEIGVESAPGQGSTFWFTARMELASETGSEDDALAALRGKRVLIVELDENRRRVVGDLMRAWGMEPLLPDGEDPGEPPDFALVAAQIIEQRGVAAALTGIDHATPVLAVGPTGSPANTFANRWGGVVPVSWPITVTGLHDATVDVSSASVSPGLVQPAVAQPARRLRILLAEDHPVNRKLATAVLERAGHGVNAVEDGRAAVTFALANDIDLVLMDVQMPIMDGVTATRLIRQSRPGGRGSVPIIGLTAQAMAEDRERGLEAGMDSYVVKPFEKAAFLAEIDRVVNRTGRRRAGGRDRPRSETVSRPFDQALLLDRIGGDQDLLRLLIETFLDDLPGKRDALVGALAAGECRELERVAHTLRGALLSLAATPSAEAARLLELGAADSSPSLAAQAAALQYELDRLVPALKTTVRTE